MQESQHTLPHLPPLTHQPNHYSGKRNKSELAPQAQNLFQGLYSEGEQSISPVADSTAVFRIFLIAPPPPLNHHCSMALSTTVAVISLKKHQITD